MAEVITPPASSRFQRLAAHWVYGGALAGLMLAGLTPLVAQGWSSPALLVWLSLAAYMLHQYEEHDDDRFRRFVNAELAGGAQALSHSAVFWINILGVWAVLVATLWLVLRIDPGWAFIAAYLLGVNALAHLAQALAMRRPNPGLWSGLVLLLPLAAITFRAAWPAATLAQHAVSLGLVVIIHLAIFAGVVRARGRTR
jgi:hypothetical protein